MTRLKLSAIQDDRPVKVTVELPAMVYRDLVAYADILANATPDETKLDPVKLIAPMLARFIASDREFTKAKRNRPAS